jgi:uncharacterized membrane protein
LQQQGNEVIEEGDEQEVITRYSGTYDLVPNESVVFEVQGALFGSANTSTSGEVVTGDVLLPLVIVVVVTLLVIGGVLLWMQSRPVSLDEQISQVSAELERLEKMHSAGRINHDVYQRQRAELEARLDSLLTQAGSDEEHVD